MRLLAVRRQTGALVIEAGGDEIRFELFYGSLTSVAGWAGEDLAAAVATVRRMRVGTFRFEQDVVVDVTDDALSVEEVLQASDRLFRRESLRELQDRGLLSQEAAPDHGAELLAQLGGLGRDAGPGTDLEAALGEAVAAQRARDALSATLRGHRP